MKLRALAVLIGAAGIAACTTGPAVDVDHYTLVAVDDHPLPAASKDLPEGYLIVAASLDFDPVTSLVRHSETIRQPDQGVESSSIDLNYIRDGTSVTINLCPPLALCFAQTELIGTVDGAELRLTHHLAGTTRSSYLFERSNRPR